MPRPLRIGLTGGIASGKSTVADLFAELGAPIIDTDIIARDVVAKGAPALHDIRKTFGNEVFADDGSLDRKTMRQIIFADSEKRRQLECILHPLIRESTESKSKLVDYPYVIIVVPLLVESPMRKWVDRVVVVDCSEETQLERLRMRDLEDEGQARRMIGAQASRDERLKIADDVIPNDGDLSATRDRVASLHRQFLEMSNPGARRSGPVIA